MERTDLARLHEFQSFAYTSKAIGHNFKWGSLELAFKEQLRKEFSVFFMCRFVFRECRELGREGYCLRKTDSYYELLGYKIQILTPRHQILTSPKSVYPSESITLTSSRTDW
jgi:hypothetical protein